MVSSWPTPSSRKTISDMAVIAKAAVQAAPYAIDRVYSYLLPRDMGAQVGCPCAGALRPGQPPQ